MADAIKTLGVVLSMSQEAGSPQNFITLGNVTDMAGPGRDRNIIMTSNLSSVAATKMAGLIDEGDFTFTINLDPSTSSHQQIVQAFEDGLQREFKYVLTDSGAAEVHFNGIVKSMPFNLPFDDKVTSAIGVAVTGKAWIAY